MLNLSVVTKTVATFTAVIFIACVAYGLVAPARFHAAWLLEAMLPGFTWLTLGSFFLGVAETAVYGAAAGLLFATLYNYYSGRSRRGAADVKAARAA